MCASVCVSGFRDPCFCRISLILTSLKLWFFFLLLFVFVWILRKVSSLDFNCRGDIDLVVFNICQHTIIKRLAAVLHNRFLLLFTSPVLVTTVVTTSHILLERIVVLRPTKQGLDYIQRKNSSYLCSCVVIKKGVLLHSNMLIFIANDYKNNTILSSLIWCRVEFFSSCCITFFRAILIEFI
jgi:hypothetical protein